MAEANVSVDQFSCPVCLELLKDPVTVACGHSFCKVCINGCWDQEVLKGVYSCPQCRRSFAQRPVVGKNTMLAEVVEKLKMMELHPASPAGPGDVECDVCTGRKLKALKSCLVCLASYCETHLQPHYQSPALRKHKLVKTSRRLQEQICSEHQKLLEVYCRTDQQCICMLCTMDDHRGHDTVSAAAERAEKQNQRKYQQKIQTRKKELEEQRNAVASYKSSAQAALEDTERMFTELICCIERKRSEISELIRAQEKAAVREAEGVLERLEQEIAELRRRNTELEQLLLTEDHLHFLQSFMSLSAPPGPADFPSITARPVHSFEEVVKSVPQLRDKVGKLCEEEIRKTSLNVKEIRMIEPQSRENFLKYSCELTLDPNTANKRLHLSEGNRVVTRSNTVQLYPDHPDRFDVCSQVLCRESVSGRCYWEVEWSGSGGEGVNIAVSYKNISRKGGSECGFGYNDQSWSLVCSPSSYSFRRNFKETVIHIEPRSCRIGVYVDYSAGTLSFYSVSDTMTLLHRVHTTFTRSIYPGFTVYPGSTLKLCCPSR
ncbi:E3 ubiquitin/ISG15 ligase TRIM25-like isoform X1 [Pygocentrus nattereri]|uniref:E3 ubiquitin/ISG15 ligase TRIM25-like isoform X1 n=1 Tax=Pygocentrus nattereri TaxID=42514 RepID=UPI001891800B|nr:E3 ubiquitin/ISG15 ligase TRIM25-like isoform X1 [Pygocentrus nattereri]